MTKQESTVSVSAFTGQWIGETQGVSMPAHIWEISQRGDYLWLLTRWEDETSYTNFSAQVIPGEAAFQIQYIKEHGKAILIDKQHFVIPGWCMGSKTDWDGESPVYDVVFSRPGIAELTAHAAYQNYVEQYASAESDA